MKATFAAQRRFALFSVFGPGAVGLLVIARTLAFYVGQDPGAALLVVAMGVGLCVGMAELLLRARRAFSLQSDIDGLPEHPSEATLDALRPELRDLLRARIDNTPLPFRTESLTPYLVGLMVMLGLLGTLLGLFETLSGAGHALTESANVDALRSGLSGPMRGLTRSFGCSAAGVSASAMLGLSAALVRRREATALLAVHRYASTALRELSPGRGQAQALLQLAAQGSALPKAATALEGVSQQLTGLAERWESAHQAAAEAQKQTLEQALKGVRVELTKASLEASEALSRTLEKQLADMAQRTGALVREHLEKSARLLQDELLTRRGADVALQKQLSEELSAMRDGLSESTRAQGALMSAQVERLEHALAAQTSAHAERTEHQQKQADAHLSALGDGAAALFARLDGESCLLHENAQRLQDSVTSRMEAAGEKLAQIAGAVGAQLETRMANEHALGERLEAGFALLEQSGRALEEALGRQELAVSELVTKAQGMLSASAEQAASGASVALEKVVTLSGEQAERLVQLATQLETAQAQHAEGLSHTLFEQAERLGEGLSGTSRLVQEAAELLKASSVEMTAVAEMFAGSVERQREAASSWLESLGELEGAVERAGRGAAADALGDQLASTQEVFARQLQFQRELFEQLRNLRAPTSGAVHGEHDVSA